MSPFTDVLIIYILVAIYCFFGLKSLISKPKFRFGFMIVYILLSVFTLFCFFKFTTIARIYGLYSGPKVGYYLGKFLLIFLTKLFLSIFLFLQDFPRMIIGLINFGKTFFDTSTSNKFIPSRRKSLTWMATGLTSMFFSGMFYGITKGKYKYTINKLSLSFKNLPVEFDGFRIVQISDIHSGSLDNLDEVARGVNMINDLNPDTVLFTGDLINQHKEEVDPFIDIFNQIKSKDGNFAVLGNHDYFGLHDLKEEEYPVYMNDFYKRFNDMNFDLINNSNREIKRGDASIKILGVENWGAGDWEPKAGDLDKALKNIKHDDFCVLMSHDPSHWEEKVLPHDRHIDLTLSGHTHGYQFGINMPGFKWSPAQYSFKRWMGLYEEKKQKLYINRGFGFLAFPGRVGMWPEITLIELKSV